MPDVNPLWECLTSAFFGNVDVNLYGNDVNLLWKCLTSTLFRNVDVNPFGIDDQNPSQWHYTRLVVTLINATMSGGLDVLTLNEEDVTKMLAATTHLGSENVHFQVCQGTGNKHTHHTYSLCSTFYSDLCRDVVVDLFSYRDPEESEKEEQQAKEQAVVAAKPEVPPPVHEDWNESAIVEPVTSWAEDAAPAAAAPVAGFGAPAPGQEDWAAQVQDEWPNAAAAPAPAAPASSWGGAGQDWSAA
ncbi:hypothetical protein NE865_00335 [Phthorimaea operculella]|nr:hypothetical protein NE865_00335 [Phthorimaea operculella]